ncbi:chemotaxis protein CheB [Botrimarina sp.]|uniref:chemotaxis protein CheB n=1 Tax=Botrimarina sp. TaxID=2795802 RepID=UPI0032EB14BF
MPNHDIVVIGGSSGGIEALSELVSGPPADLPAAVFVVQHLPADSHNYLPKILAKRSELEPSGTSKPSGACSLRGTRPAPTGRAPVKIATGAQTAADWPVPPPFRVLVSPLPPCSCPTSNN